MFIYWILFPLLFGAVLTGLGLGVRRLSVPFTPALIVPAGFAAALVIATAFTWSGSTQSLAGPGMTILGLIGWAFGWKDVRRAVRGGALRREWAWMVASVAGFLVFGASVIASGHPTFTGYNEIVDIAHQMDWGQYLGAHGRTPIKEGVSASLNVVNRTLADGYPAGPQSILGTFPKTFGMNLTWAWQPYLAIIASVMVAAAYALLRQVTDSRVFAALGGFAAGQASCLIGYGQLGGIKELAAAGVLMTTAGVIPMFAAEAERPAWRVTLPFTITIAAAFSIFGITVVPWLGILAAGALLITWRKVSLRAALARGACAAVVGAIVSIPTIVPALSSLTFGSSMKDATAVGNLAHPLSPWAGTGIWFTDDHRFGVEGSALTVSIVVGVIVILLALVGLWTAWHKKAPGLIVLGIASVVGMTILIVKFGPWVEQKGIDLAAPVVLVLAAAGLSGLQLTRRKVVIWGTWIGVVGLVVAGLYSDTLRYGSAQLGPYARLKELQHYNQRFAGLHGALIIDWDENAEYQLRDVKGVSPFNFPFVSTKEWEQSTQRPKSFQYSWDMDQLDPKFATFLDIVVIRRSPGQSRPARQYQLVDEGRFFDVWQRTADTPEITHLALSGVSDRAETAKCQKFVDALPPAASVTIAPSPTVSTATFDPAMMTRGLTGTVDKGTVMTPVAGTAHGTVDVGAGAGLYDVYAATTSHLEINVTVAGRKMTMQRDPSMANRPQFLKSVLLPAGAQAVTVQSGRNPLFPGSSKKFNRYGFVGPVQLVPRGGLHPPLITGTAGTMTCPDAADWVETP